MKHIEVVAAIISKGDKIFATQRGYGEWKDCWQFPAGGIRSRTACHTRNFTNIGHKESLALHNIKWYVRTFFGLRL